MTFPPFLVPPGILWLAGVAGPSVWLVLGVGVADLLVPGVGDRVFEADLDLGGDGLGLELLLEMLLWSEEPEELCWLPAGLLLGDVVFAFFDFSGVFFLGTITLWGGGIWMVGSEAAGDLLADAFFLPSSISPIFFPMKVTEEDLCKVTISKLFTGKPLVSYRRHCWLRHLLLLLFLRGWPCRLGRRPLLAAAALVRWLFSSAPSTSG